MAIGRKTGGRQKGSLNKRTRLLEAEARAAADKIKSALGDAAFEGDAHSLLTLVYKDQSKPIELRLDAAKAAVRYEKPALSTVEQKGEGGSRSVIVIPQGTQSVEHWLEQHAHLTDQGETKQ